MAHAAHRGSLGRAGEESALAWYRARGFELVAANWRCPLGELDLVMRRGRVLAFVEVKTRAGSAFGGGYEAVGRQKQRKLRQLGEAFLAAAGRPDLDCRFDVASVVPGRGTRGVHVFEDAF